MKDLTKAKEVLRSDGYTCVMCRENKVYTSDKRGVKPLVFWLEAGEKLQGFSAADKVVGKATAFLYVLHKVTSVYAHVISKSAFKVLTEHGISVEFDELADNIVNRRGDGICPFEAAVEDVSEPELAYEVIRMKMREMNITV